MRFKCGLENHYVRGPEALALRVVLHGELNALALGELPIAGGLDRAIVDEDVLAVLLRDKPESFCGVEPLDRSGRHDRFLSRSQRCLTGMAKQSKERPTGSNGGAIR